MTQTGGTPERATDRLSRRLRSLRMFARGFLLFEQLWPALWPPLGVAGVFVCLALLDLPGLLYPWLHLGVLGGFAVAFMVLLVRAVRSVVTPDDALADRRLERTAGLTHRPLAALSDRPVGNDPVAAALWQAHVLHAAQRIAQLRTGLARPGLAAIDRRALRIGLGVALVASFAIAGRDAPSRLAEGLTPSWPRQAAAPGMEIQAWIAPPAYTRLPPVFLKSEFPNISAPAGARLTVNLTGGGIASGRPGLTLGNSETPLLPLDKSSFQGEKTLQTGGRLAIRDGSQELAAWNLTVIADRPPSAGWTDRPRTSRIGTSQIGASGRGPRLSLPWQTEDDYGVVFLQANLELTEPVEPSPPALQLILPLPGDNLTKAKGVSVLDLSAHPWAGLPVRGRLIARDALGQSGESTEINFTLPERVFQHPVARVLIQLRRGLTLHPKDRAQILAVLDNLLLAPEVFDGDFGAFLNLAGLCYALARNHSPGAVPETQQRMWELALQLEDGQVDNTARALENARQAADEALERAAQEGNPENLANIDQKLRDLEQAIRNRLQAILEQARRDGTEDQIHLQAMQMDATDLNQLAEAARDAAREGRMKDAEQRVAELKELLDQLRDGQSTTAQAAQKSAQQRAEKRERGEKQIGAVQDMIARQGGLLDHVQGRSQEKDPSERTLSEKTKDRALEQKSDQQVQQALRRALGELMQQFGDLTGDVPPSLSKADVAMREAGQSLGANTDPTAAAAEQRAIEALQKGAREMGQTMSKKFGLGPIGVEEPPGDGDGPRADQMGNSPGEQARGDLRNRTKTPHNANKDPFGRPQGEAISGSDEGGDVQVPEERERQRAQAIQNELRRRGAQRTRPQDELDYIERLLKRF